MRINFSFKSKINLIFIISSAFLLTPAQAITYTATRLEPGPSPWMEQTPLNNTFAYVLNNNGQVVGSSGLYNGQVVGNPGRYFGPFGYEVQGNIWQSGSSTPVVLNSFADPALTFGYYLPYRLPAAAHPNAINDLGQTVGTASVIENYSREIIYELSGQAAIWQPGSTTPEKLGTQLNNGYVPKAINNNGQIAGTIGQRPVFWESYNSEPVYLDNPAIYVSNVSDINSSGQVVGYLVPTAGTAELYGAVWQYGSNTRLLLSFSGGVGSIGYAINDSGLVVGVADYNIYNPQRAALWLPNSYIPIDLNGGDFSSAHGINANGQIVGSMLQGNGDRVAVFWQTDSTSPIDLNTLVALQSGDFLTDAYGINDRGQIIALSSNGETGFSSFLLTPVSVPLPATKMTFVIGLMALIYISRQKFLMITSSHY